MSRQAQAGWWQAMSEIQLREVLPGECEDTGSLTQRAYAGYALPGDPLWDSYFGMLADVAHRAAFATVLIAVAGGHIVGTATVELDRTIEGTQVLQPGQASLRLLAVDPQARGRGVGRRLVQACVQVARRAGKEVATLHTTGQMMAAQRIYRSWASGAIRLATWSCTPTWSCKPSGCRSGDRTEKVRITPGVHEPIGAGRMAGAGRPRVIWVTGLLCR